MPAMLPLVIEFYRVQTKLVYIMFLITVFVRGTSLWRSSRLNIWQKYYRYVLVKAYLNWCHEMYINREALTSCRAVDGKRTPYRFQPRCRLEQQEQGRTPCLASNGRRRRRGTIRRRQPFLHKRGLAPPPHKLHLDVPRVVLGHLHTTDNISPMTSPC